MGTKEKEQEIVYVVPKFESIYTEEDRKEKISKEYNRLLPSLNDLDDKRQITLKKLFNDAAFMAVTLEETRLIIQRDGIIEQYTNGATQCGFKKSSAVDVYDKMISTYLKTIEQINKSLPEGQKVGPADEINKFINEGK